MSPDPKNNRKSLSQLLRDYSPEPGEQFHQRMRKAPWKQKETTMQPHTTRYGWQFGIAIVIVLAMLAAVSVPAVRASLSAWLGLKVAPSDQMPVEPVSTLESIAPQETAMVQASPQPPATAQLSGSTHAAPAAGANQPPQISQLSGTAGWKVLSASQLPPGYAFKDAYYEPSQQEVIVSYFATRPLPGGDPSMTETKTISLVQARHNDFIPLEVAPSTEVQDVQVNGQPAVFAIGAWDTEFNPGTGTPEGGSFTARWRNDLPIQNLYWQVGDVYLALITDDPSVTRQDLLAMASSIGK